MSVSVEISGSAIPWSRRMQAALNSPRLLKVAAAEGARTVRKHFLQLESARHRSAAKFHFYAQAARATTLRVAGNDGFVDIAKTGIALRYFGGTVVPRQSKWLTIPVADEAVGRRIREFPSSQLSWRINKRTGKGVVLLGERVLYALTKKTEHQPDPSVIPTDAEMVDNITTVINSELDRI